MSNESLQGSGLAGDNGLADAYLDRPADIFIIKEDVASIHVHPRLKLLEKEGRARLHAMHIANQLSVPLDLSGSAAIEFAFHVDRAQFADLYDLGLTALMRTQKQESEKGYESAILQYEFALKIEHLNKRLPDGFGLTTSGGEYFLWVSKTDYEAFRDAVRRICTHFELEVSADELPESPREKALAARKSLLNRMSAFISGTPEPDSTVTCIVIGIPSIVALAFGLLRLVS